MYFLTTCIVLATLLSPACPESVCPSSLENNESTGDDTSRSDAGATSNRRVTEDGQCRNVAELFPEALPISPNKVLCNMTDVTNVNQTCFDEADARFYSALTEDIMSSAIVWINLAMPNTGTTSLDSYMALGGAMSPVDRSGGCEIGCVSRVRKGPLVPVGSAMMAHQMGLSSAALQQCDPALFRRFSALVRCPQSGGHMDYQSMSMMSKTCLRLRKNKQGGYEMKITPGKDGKVNMNSAMHKFVAPGTIMRDPAKYHYKDYKVGHAPDWKDSGVCRIWDESRSAGKEAHGFSCRKSDCESLDNESNTWCLDGDFNSYMRFAHHRWNIFTRMLAGTLAPRHDPVHYYKDVKEMYDSAFTREMAIAQNEQGVEAPDFKLAVQRLERMPYFSIFERMEESVELLCFTFCYDCSKLGFEYKPKKRKDIPSDVVKGVEVYNTLDVALYKHANDLFSQRIQWMQEAKADGITCDLLMSGCGMKGMECGESTMVSVE